VSLLHLYLHHFKSISVCFYKNTESEIHFYCLIIPVYEYVEGSYKTYINKLLLKEKQLYDHVSPRGTIKQG